MDNDDRSPAGRSTTLESLDCSSAGSETLTGKAYDFGAAADHNAELFRGNNNDFDKQAYDFGAAADYNIDLLKRNDNETRELALSASFNTTLLSSSYAATLAPEAQIYVPVGFDSGKWNEVFSTEPNFEGLMTGFVEAGDISKRFPPTPLVNDEEIPDQIATAPSFSPSHQELSGLTHGSLDVALRGQEGRLSCDCPRCNKTFPRKYEQFRVVCPVYGCHRTAKPFKRADKFMEHFRKHDNSRSYRCLIETCQSASFDIPGLIGHLTKSHYGGDDAQPNLDFINRKGLGVRSIPFWLHHLCLEGYDVCPLAPTGCTWRVRADLRSDFQYCFEMQKHIVTRELYDRLQGKELLRNFFVYDDNKFLDNGTKNCMLCSFQASGYFHRELYFNHLVTGHSKGERGSVRETTYRILRDYLTWWYEPRGERLNVPVLKNECTEAGFRFVHWQKVPAAFLESHIQLLGLTGTSYPHPAA
ncbi:hypothetical protein EAF00_001244 [Botryotinia globosa]|nr:hypothetical protein EAF00_001244 [Botryotinia globosa]